MKKTLLLCLAGIVLASGSASADLISEFEPNPAGTDPADTTFELSGVAGADFNYRILSIENDGANGVVDRASDVSGTFDANGLAVLTVPDLENPSFTVLLTGTDATAAIGDDLDADDDGVLELGTLGTIFDAVSVSDNAGDDATLYAGNIAGGTNILFNGEFEPLGVFRDASTGDFFQYVTVDFGGANEHIGIFAANGGPELDPSTFTGGDATATTYGAINPTLVAVPEPTAIALFGLVGLGLGLVRRRDS